MKAAVPALADSGDAGGEDGELEREWAAFQSSRGNTQVGMGY